MYPNVDTTIIIPSEETSYINMTQAYIVILSLLVLRVGVCSTSCRCSSVGTIFWIVSINSVRIFSHRVALTALSPNSSTTSSFNSPSRCFNSSVSLSSLISIWEGSIQPEIYVKEKSGRRILFHFCFSVHAAPILFRLAADL